MKARIAILACISATVCFPGAQFAGGQEALDYSFPSNPCDTQPDSAPVFDGNGNLFGTCTNGTSDGLVYELSSKVGGAWTEQAIYTFGLGSSTATGSSPNGVIFDAKMVNLYGTTSDGGAYGSGVVFELSPKVGDGWTQAVLYSFGANGSNDGSTPMGSLVFDTSGNLYGTTSGGGANFDSGAVFELSPESGGVWTEKILYSFSTLDNVGSSPQNGLILDAKGNLYGTTNGGFGTVFELAPDSSEIWTAQVLGDCGPTSDRAANLDFDSAGDLYGVSAAGGSRITAQCMSGRPLPASPGQQRHCTDLTHPAPTESAQHRELC